jgi:hypothetical protein
MHRRTLLFDGPVLLAFSLLVCACGGQAAPAPKPNAPDGGYLGATRSMGSMTASPKRCKFSFLYDDYVTQRDGTAGRPTPKPNVRDAVLRGPDYLAGEPVRVAIRGAYMGDKGPIGTLLVEYGESKVSSELVSDGKAPSAAIFTELMAKATSGDNPVKITVTLATPAAGQKTQRVDIDSMDIAVDGGPCKTTPAS